MNRWSGKLMLAVSALLLGGCGVKPQGVVESFFEAARVGDLERARSYLTTTDASVLNPAEEGVDVVKDIFSKLQYEVIDEERDGNTTVVTTNVTSVDLVRVMGQVMQELLPVAMASAFSDDNVNTEALTQQYMLNAIRSEDAPKTTSKVRVTLRRTDDGWKIEPDDALLNGVTGNLITAMKRFE